MSPTKTRFVAGRVLWMALAGPAAAAALTACAGPSTTIEQAWKSPSSTELSNVVTACMTRDGALRRTCEDDMARKLLAAGVRATPLYAALPGAEIGERDGTKAKLLAAGYDGVIALRLVSREQQIEYVPGSFDYYWDSGWWGGYDGYLYSETVVRIETSAYSLADNQLVWSALSRTVDPDTVREGIDEVAGVAANAMARQRVVAGTLRPTGGA